MAMREVLLGYSIGGVVALLSIVLPFPRFASKQLRLRIADGLRQVRSASATACANAREAVGRWPAPVLQLKPVETRC